jgi:hypothetical protein
LNKSWYSHYQKVRSHHLSPNNNDNAFAALKADGSIASWGCAEYGGIGAPSGKGYTKIYSDKATFIALKADGSNGSKGIRS